MRVIATRPNGQHDEIEMDLVLESANDAYGPNFRMTDTRTHVSFICMPNAREMDALTVMFAASIRGKGH